MQAIDVLYKVYKEAFHNNPGSYGARVHEAIRDLKFPNGQPLNILKGITILNALNDFKDHMGIDGNEIELISKATGYSVAELKEKL